MFKEHIQLEEFLYYIMNMNLNLEIVYIILKINHINKL